MTRWLNRVSTALDVVIVAGALVAVFVMVLA